MNNLSQPSFTKHPSISQPAVELTISTLLLTKQNHQEPPITENETPNA